MKKFLVMIQRKPSFTGESIQGHREFLKNQKEKKPDKSNVDFSTLQGELGLKLEAEKDVVGVMVVDKVQK